jgi:putative endonuclease
MPRSGLTAPHAPRTALDRRRRGLAAEVLAARHLREHGLEVLARNIRYRCGEIDLLCRDGEVLVVVEVRMRARGGVGGGDFGGALASVGSRKRRSLLRATRFLLLQSAALARHRLRFDVVAIERAADRPLSLHWIRDAFRAGS